MAEIKTQFCPFCGRSDAELKSEAKGVVNIVFIACNNCFARGPYLAEFVDGPPKKVQEKVLQYWNLRSRVRLNEDLVDLVARARKLCRTVRLGCKAKTPAAQEASAAGTELYAEIDSIVKVARSEKLVQHTINRSNFTDKS